MPHSESIAREAKASDKLDTKFGTVTVLERKGGKITVLIDANITATFPDKEFFEQFLT